MKKLFMGLLCKSMAALAVVILSLGAHAQNAIEVQRFQQWGREYLTVTNNWNGIFATVVKGELPSVLSVITEINGLSTTEMTPEDFYRQLTSKEQCMLAYQQKQNGVNTPKNCIITPRMNYYLAEGVETISPFEKPDNINISSDIDVDFFKYSTYDVSVTGSDPLTDKNILERLCQVFEGRGMKRNQETPDVYFTVAKSLQQSTNSVYVPKTSQVVNTGSTSSWQKNIFTGKQYLATQQHYTTVSSGGYTHTNVNATFHLIFTVFDGERVRRKENEPVVWRLDYNEFSSNAIDLMESVNTGVAYWCMNYPFAQPMFSYSINTVGVAFSSPDDIITGQVIDVLPGTDAYEKGLRGGMTIERAYQHGAWTFVGAHNKRTYFKANSYKKKNGGFLIPILEGWIPIPLVFPLKTKNVPTEYLTKKRTRMVSSRTPKQYFVVRDGDGSTFKIRAPFEKAQYNYEYIPTMQ